MKKKLTMAFVVSVVLVGVVGFALRNEYLDASETGNIAHTSTVEFAALESENKAQQEELEALKSEMESLREQLEENNADSALEDAMISAASSASSTSVPTSSQPTLPTASSSTPASQPPATIPLPQPKQNAGTIFEGYTVNITDKTTLATRSAGFEWPFLTYYFLASDGSRLGSIT